MSEADEKYTQVRKNTAKNIQHQRVVVADDDDDAADGDDVEGTLFCRENEVVPGFTIYRVFVLGSVQAASLYVVLCACRGLRIPAALLRSLCVGVWV